MREETDEPRCPCGGVILADTEDWPVPICNACYEKLEEVNDMKSHEVSASVIIQKRK